MGIKGTKNGLFLCVNMLKNGEKSSVYAVSRKFMPVKNRGIKIFIYANFYAN